MHYQTIRPLLFRLDPEQAHRLVEWIAKKLVGNVPLLQKQLAKTYQVHDKRLVQHLLGTTFPNPVGIGAGFDKNATMIPLLNALGFGAVEFGTLTPLSQAGNPKPRLFRFVEEESLQNAMGFNNDGMEAILKRVKALYPYDIPLGANIGKNKITGEEDALEDYEKLISAFESWSDYLVINISSPNTPGLRDLQNEAFIQAIFETAKRKTTKPVLLKIAPDLHIDTALQLSQTALDYGAEGIIATNTTIDYSLLPHAKTFGGLSGKVLKEKSFTLFEEIAKAFFAQTTLISVGGIDSGIEAYRRIKAGANLIQILTALIYQGPSLAHDINRTLLQELEKDGFSHISEAVGSDRR